MNEQLINNVQALRMFFDDDIYSIAKKTEESNLKNDTSAVLLPNHEVASIENQHTSESLTVESKITAQKPIDFIYKGQNERKILILVNDDLNAVSNEIGTELLRKLLLAIQLKGKDFALLNYAKYKHTNLKTLIDFFESKVVLSFGVNADELGIEDREKNILTTEGDTKLILTSNLVALTTNNPAKTALWNSLKALNL